jgi:hypothetical protein
MDFLDWYSDPERGPEILRALATARSIAGGESEDEVLFLFAEFVMRRAWTCACTECRGVDLRRPPEQRLH